MNKIIFLLVLIRINAMLVSAEGNQLDTTKWSYNGCMQGPLAYIQVIQDNKTLIIPSPVSITGAVMSEAGRLGICAWDKICICDTLSNEVEKLFLLEKDVSRFCFDNNKLVTTFMNDNRIHIWDMETRQKIKEFSCPGSTIFSLFMKKNIIGTLSDDGTAQVLDYCTETIKTKKIDAFQLSLQKEFHDSTLLIVNMDRVYLWDVEKNLENTFLSNGKNYRAATVSDNQLIVTLDNAEIHIWDIQAKTKKELKIGFQDDNILFPIKLCVDELIIPLRNKIYLINMTTRNHRIIDHKYSIGSGAVLKYAILRGSCLITASNDQKICIWDLKTDFLTTIFNTKTYISNLFIKDNKLLVVQDHGIDIYTCS